MLIGLLIARHEDRCQAQLFSWWMLDLRKLENSESRVTFERRVRNICSCFSDHGCNLDHHHFLMASSTQHFDVFVLGLISGKRYPSKKGNRKTPTLELQSFVVARSGDGKTFVGQISHESFEPCRCRNKTMQRSEARKLMFLFGYLERKQSRRSS